MPARSEHTTPQGTDDQEVVQRICLDFQQRLMRGEHPRIDDLVAIARESVKERLLEQLLKIEYFVLGPRNALADVAHITADDETHSKMLDASTDLGKGQGEQDFELIGVPKSLQSNASFSKRYEIESEVARGGMGVVYRGHHRILKMPVAIKVLLPYQSHERFLREARVIASLRSKNIVRVYDFEVLDDESPVICMEWIEGANLNDRIESHDSMLSERDVLPWMIDIATGMTNAEEQGVLHRDLKPHNILIDGNSQAFVSDFGLAASSRFVDDATLTKSGGLMGTVHYMAPEQAEDPRRVDSRADIYGFGATFYHALTKRTPFQGESVLKVLFQHKSEPLISPRTINPEISEGLCRIIEICLAKNPSDRFSSFAEIKSALESLEASQGRAIEPIDERIESSLERFNNMRTAILSCQFEEEVYEFSGGKRLRFVKGDIAKQEVDAIVSSDDSEMSMGGGTSASIAIQAGEDYEDTARKLAPGRLGRVVVTSGGNLPARLVFHAITIDFDAPGDTTPSRDIITSIVDSSLYAADTHRAKSIAYPMLGTGAAGFSRGVSLDEMFRSLASRLALGVTDVEEVRIVVMDRQEANDSWMKNIQSLIDRRTSQGD